MAHSRSSEAPSRDVPGIFRRRSLLWLIPERAARRLSWLIVLLICILPLIVIAATTLSRSAAKEEARLSRLLSERLCVPVQLRLMRRDGPGQYALSGVVIEKTGSAGPSLQANRGTYQAPGLDLPGQLALEGGTLSMDLETWTKPPAREVMRMLHNVENSVDLRCLSLSDVTAQLHLRREVVSLRSVIGRVELTEEGRIHGALVGQTEHGRLGAKLELGEGLHAFTVLGRPLPWVKNLTTPALGETLAQLLESPEGKLTLANDPGAGSAASGNWRIDVKSTFDLGRLPKEIGLGEITGKLRVSLDASGRLGESASLCAALALTDNTTGTLTTSALRNLNFLLTGQWGTPPLESRPQTFDLLNLSVTVTPEEIRLNGMDGNRPAGIIGPGGVQLLRVPTAESIPIPRFLERLEELGRRHREARSP
jgi:hypothetical protein